MLLLVTGMIFCYAQRGSLSVAAPSMMQELNLSQTMMGILLSAFFVTYAFMQMPAGWLVDRFGVKSGYALGYVVWSVGATLTGFARSVPAFFGARMLLGIGQAVAFPASARAVANWFQQQERGTVVASYLTGVRLGQALINGVGLILLGLLGYKLFFLVIGVVPLVWLLPWFAFLGRWEKGENAPPAGEVRKAAVPGVSFMEGLALFRQRSVIGIFLGFFAFDYAWFVFVNWLPSYLVLERKFSKGEAAIYGSLPFIVMSVVIVFSGLASDWLVRRGRFGDRGEEIPDHDRPGGRVPDRAGRHGGKQNDLGVAADAFALRPGHRQPEYLDPDAGGMRQEYCWDRLRDSEFRRQRRRDSRSGRHRLHRPGDGLLCSRFHSYRGDSRLWSSFLLLPDLTPGRMGRRILAIGAGRPRWIWRSSFTRSGSVLADPEFFHISRLRR